MGERLTEAQVRLLCEIAGHPGRKGVADGDALIGLVGQGVVEIVLNVTPAGLAYLASMEKDHA